MATRSKSLRSLTANRILVVHLLAATACFSSCGPTGALAQGPAGTGTAKGSNRWAILIAVDDYANLTDLSFCTKDQEGLRDQLLASGFPADQVFLLTDETKEARYRPFKTNIEKQLELVLGLLEKDDLLVIGFSGHGVQLGKTSYLCPADADLERPDTLLPLEKIYEQLENCNASLKLMMIDACRNDPRPPGKRSARSPREANQAFAKTLETPPRGILLMTSCAPGETAQEDPQLKHGVFMYHVLAGLRGGADRDKNGRISLTELYQYSNLETKKYVARVFNDSQRPGLKGDLTDDFELASISGTAASTVPKIAAKDSKPATNPMTPSVTDSAASESATKPALKTVKNSIGMELVLIPAGKFRMGSPPSEKGRDKDEEQKDVELTRSFYLGKTEVTQAQWRAVTGTEPWKGKDSVHERDNYPATYVSWDDAQEFCRKLSKTENRTYRLPTEAEWEYACRAGTTTRFSFGDSESRLGDYGWFKNNTSALGRSFAREVGRKKGNPFGLYDIHGNVYEWCEDVYVGNFPGGTDPKVTTEGSIRVCRGGSWDSFPAACSSADRFRLSQSIGYFDLGFRVAIDPSRE